MQRVKVKPVLLRWASLRSRVPPSRIRRSFPRYDEWMSGKADPTLKQLERFAEQTRTPIGFLFLDAPPEEELPIPDFRTVASRAVQRPSPDLLDTIYACEQRQEWYREYALAAGERPLRFVASRTIKDDVVEVAAEMRRTLAFEVQERGGLGNWEAALRRFVDRADGVGVLVMISGIVGSNTSRRLDPSEFRGFTLSDDIAPVVFVNGADTKAAQMFTLAHELAHLWIGKTGVSDEQAVASPAPGVERWCNAVAAEFLVPLAFVKREYRRGPPLAGEVNRLARLFKVSTLVILRRVHDAGGISAQRFRQEYGAEVRRLRAVPRGKGGNFYATVPLRVSGRFARAMVASALEGETLYRDAFRMLGVASESSFDRLAGRLGVA